MTEYLAIDAFCGAGGLSLGLQSAGFKIVGGFDLDTVCIETLKANQKYFKHNVFQANIKEMLNGILLKKLAIKRGDIQLLSGGPPCQGFSVQRTIGGDQDERNLLVDDYADLIIELLPKFFLLENVPGIGGKRGLHVMEKFKNKIASHGYCLHERILNAQGYGVPQRRKRYFLIGELAILPIFLWPKLCSKEESTVKDAIGFLPPPPYVVGPELHVYVATIQ